jgi:hypothetical protein
MSLNIVFPISKADAHLAEPLGKVIAQLGPNRKHFATIVASPEAGREALLFQELIKNMFADVRMANLESNPTQGWPRACNQHFAAAALRANQDNRDFDHWMWFEMDACPLVSDWCDKLSNELTMGKKPFMGWIEPTKFVQPDGTVTEEGRHMVGVGIYPKNAFEASNLIRYAPMTPVPFDVYIRWEVVPNCHHTDIFVHRWSTEKWSNAGKRVTMEDVKPLKFKIAHARPFDLHGKVVAHGGKDGSLHEMVLDIVAPVGRPKAAPKESDPPPMLDTEDVEEPEFVMANDDDAAEIGAEMDKEKEAKKARRPRGVAKPATV